MDKRIDCHNVLQEYRDKATPGEGKLLHEDGTDAKDRYITELLFDFFGGDMKTLKVESIRGKNLATPDALWNNVYWEYKSVTTMKSIDNRIRQGWHQLRENAERKGLKDTKIGLVIDISKRYQDLNKTSEAIENSFIKRVKYSADLIIIDDGKIIKILRK